MGGENVIEDGITWDDISEFTWEDLAKLNITWEDACLSKAKLLEKIQNQDTPVPIDLYERFKKVCETLPEDAKPKVSVFNSVKKIGGAMFLILEMLEHTEWVSEHAHDLTEIAKDIINHFS